MRTALVLLETSWSACTSEAGEPGAEQPPDLSRGAISTNAGGRTE